SMRGGQLSVTVNLPGQASDLVNPNNPNPDFTGSLTVKDFTMVNQSLLARLFSAGSLTGFGDLMGGDGMTLDELNMPFSSRNNVISVNGARVRGPAIGASADGYIDRPKGMLALKGSLVPAYGVNSLISNVPLLGDILASKKGEGIFGITYSMAGNAEQPTITTNPLSILTPGILRRIFEGHIPTAANAPSNAQAAAPPPEQKTPPN
ncbi:MAG TPA: AsmA-like C-terminal domain-containing protein, partial [Rhizomicrobium sp.]|nr:AsmA-like C-terminal domain-containing protein [Rhizomicrobium sp.]